MSDDASASDSQEQPIGHDDGKVDAIGAVIVVVGLVAMFIYGIWSAGLS